MSPVRPLIRAILIDLSGTLHIGDKPTPNAVEALRRLRQARVPFRFCSNTSKESTNALRKRLFRMGFEARSDGVKEEIWTSIGAVKRTLENQGLKRCVARCEAKCLLVVYGENLEGPTSYFPPPHGTSALAPRVTQMMNLMTL